MARRLVIFLKNHSNTFMAEFMGTFSLVLFGCAAIVVNDQYNGVIGHGGIAASFGLIVMIMIYSVGNISGAHLNPAVTLGFYVAGRINPVKGAVYIFAQFSGALLASWLLAITFTTHANLGATLPAVPVLTTFLVEVCISMVLMFVILNVSTGHREKGIMAGVAIGATVALAALIMGPLTGASMNPARSLAPALASNNLESLWVYLSAPFVGAGLAYPLCRVIQGKSCCEATA